MGGSGLDASAMLLVGVLATVLVVLWILLPFAVFGVKDRLTRLLAEARRTNALLEQLVPEKARPPRELHAMRKPDRSYPGEVG